MPPSPHEPLDTDHQLPPRKKASVGPIIGSIIIIVLLIIGALYVWGKQLNKMQQPIPYIPSGTTTITVTQ